MGPHDPFGIAGSAAGVEDPQVVRAAIDGRRRIVVGDQLLVVQRPVGYWVAGLAHLDGRPEQRQVAPGLLYPVGQFGREEHRLGVGVLQQMAQLPGQVAVVHIAGSSPGLERPKGDLAIGVAVVEVEPHVVARADAELPQRSRQPSGPILKLLPGSADRMTHHRIRVWHHFRNCFPRSGQVQGHGE